MKWKKWLAGLTASFLIAGTWIVSGGMELPARAKEYERITLYFMTSLYEPYISGIASDCPQSYQIPLDSIKSIDYDKKALKISKTGLIEPNLKTTSTYFLTTHSMVDVTTGVEGVSEVTVVTDSGTYQYYVDLVDYGEYYSQRIINDWMADNIKPTMTDHEKLEAVCKYVCSFDYAADKTIGGTAMVFENGGDCLASTATVNYMCRQLGMTAWSQATGHLNHHNSIVALPDHTVYEVDCGYVGKAPRTYTIEPSSEQVAEDKTFVYHLTDDGTATIMSCTGDMPEEVVIPSEVKEHQVTGISSGIFEGNITLKKITIPEGFTQIGSKAFKNCLNLETVILPDSVSLIGNSAFSNCRKLRDVDLPEHLTAIYSYAFEGCSALERVVMPDTVETLGNSAFRDCENLRYVHLSSSLTELPSYLFDNDAKLESITVPEGVTKIGGTFCMCTGLKTIILPESLTEIGFQGFEGCVQLRSLVVPKNVTSIGQTVFWLDHKLVLTVLNPDCEIKDHNNPDMKEIRGYSGSTAEEYAIQHNVKFTAITPGQSVDGDVNQDGVLDTVDVVFLQRWLLQIPDAKLPDGKAADLNKDGVIDIFDLCFMKSRILGK